MTTKRRQFGWVRRLPSGRFQASYIGPDGQRRAAGTTFATRTDADRWLTVVRSTLLEGRWRDPARGRETLGPYFENWIRHRHGLRPQTVELYEGLNRRHIAPYLADVELRSLTPEVVRRWRSRLAENGVTNTTAAKAYRLLRAVCSTAVEDDILERNPCRIRNGGQETPAERPTLTVDQVFDLAGRVPPRFRALVLLTTFASLRFGEAVALRRTDLDLSAGTITVSSTLVELRGKQPMLAPPKSRAGYRTIDLPRPLVSELAHHLSVWVSDEPSAFLFTGTRGSVIRRGNLQMLLRWKDNVAAIGAPGLHFHDLRHTGNTLAARVPGTSTRDLMQRMGHDSMRAAMIYQHNARDAQQRIAAGLETQMTERGSVSAAARRQHATDPSRSPQGGNSDQTPQNPGV